jgi:hypothetical protein
MVSCSDWELAAYVVDDCSEGRSLDDNQVETRGDSHSREGGICTEATGKRLLLRVYSQVPYQMFLASEGCIALETREILTCGIAWRVIVER